jgi:hypothetical protein
MLDLCVVHFSGIEHICILGINVARYYPGGTPVFYLAAANSINMMIIHIHRSLIGTSSYFGADSATITNTEVPLPFTM